MSKFTRMASTSHMLSLAAMEEASRRGLREADLPDLFLALVLNEQPGGQVLRDQGITITSARAAVEEYQQEQIASLGIIVDLPSTGRIVFHETAGYTWSKRANDLLRRASGRRGRGEATAVLRELLDEPSGLVSELLLRCGTTRGLISEDLDRAAPRITPPPTDTRRHGGTLSHATHAFVPAPVGAVWELLASPRRIPEWDASQESVAAGLDPVTPGATWFGPARTVSDDGRPVRVHEKYRHRSIGLEELLHEERVVWRTTYPDAPSSLALLTAFDLAPATGGTRLTITMTWQRRRGVRAVTGFVLAPVRRFLIWVKLAQISAAISRVFRQP